jgi:hypothetical protein
MAGEGLGITQMGMGVHDPDLAAEEGAGLGPLEDLHGAAVISGRAVEEPGPVGADEVLVQHVKVLACLTR